MTMHPVARLFMRDTLMDRAVAEETLREIAELNKGLLVGGFNVDVVILAIYWLLSKETDEGGVQVLTSSEIDDKINDCLSVIYAGLI